MNTYEVKPVNARAVITINPVDLNKAKIRFISYKFGDPIRAYFENEITVVVEGSNEESEIEIWQGK